MHKIPHRIFFRYCIHFRKQRILAFQCSIEFDYVTQFHQVLRVKYCSCFYKSLFPIKILEYWFQLFRLKFIFIIYREHSSKIQLESIQKNQNNIYSFPQKIAAPVLFPSSHLYTSIICMKRQNYIYFHLYLVSIKIPPHSIHTSTTHTQMVPSRVKLMYFKYQAINPLPVENPPIWTTYPKSHFVLIIN